MNHDWSHIEFSLTSFVTHALKAFELNNMSYFDSRHATRHGVEGRTEEGLRLLIMGSLRHFWFNAKRQHVGTNNSNVYNISLSVITRFRGTYFVCSTTRPHPQLPFELLGNSIPNKKPDAFMIEHASSIKHHDYSST